MSDPKSANSLFTYGLGLIMGLPGADLFSGLFEPMIGFSGAIWVRIAATIVFGALGCTIGYYIDRWREQRSNSNG